MDVANKARQGSAKRSLALDAARVSRLERDHYAIIDIGSNSVRLVVYDGIGRAPLPRFNEKSLCRLGEGLAQTGAIAPENFSRTIEALRRFRAIADAMGVDRIDATATEAMRRASNGPELQRLIEAETGLTIRILSGAEEARFAALGVVSGFFRPVGLVGDMGGGSLEVAEALDDHVGDRWVSLPLGALPVEALMAQGLSAAKDRIDAMLKADLPPALTRPVFYPVGGGWRAFARVHQMAVGAPIHVVHGYTLSTDAVRDFAKTLYRMAPDKLAGLPGMPARRARTLPAAALLLDRVLKRLAPEEVVFSALGLREGWLYSQLSERERYLDPLVEGAQAIGLPLARVPGFAPELVRWTATLFPGETAAETRLRVAVCALSDHAWRDHPDVRAEESFRRLLHFPFIGITHAERAYLASCIHARYGGKFDDPYLGPAQALLSKAARRRAQVLGRAISLAYRISAGMPPVLAGSRLTVASDCVHLAVGEAARVPDSEAVADRLKLLASAIGLKKFRVETLAGST
ncbi:Ppx/GppA family phosphatase [Lichenihabitans sp. Uapishka_5]|uniref:Ppx/GppA family phosphatase n=1 Tax=Lichenihabitans sp. Uapishka_5 TaxID=3037302 RepID=UPI0029E7DC8F|nr:Ppx/GppA family phosphatase [Lichenihabitans sp. Uapishka_5]MDX7953950.1 Ppx/GppA family phosphatase [Lichenihabitans sp. Uapishka_5]